MKEDLKEILDGSSVGFMIMKKDGIIKFKNKKADSFLKLLDKSSGGDILEKLREKCPGFELEDNKETVASFTTGEDKKYFFKLSSHKKQIDLEDSYILDIVDISEYKKDDSIYKTIFNSVASAIVITDLDGTIEKVNPAFEHLTGYTKEEAIGQNPRILKSDYHSDKFFKNLWETLKMGQVWHGVFRDVIKSGEHIWEKSSISPIKDSSGKIYKYVAIKENITRQKEQELELKKYSYQDYLTGLYNRRKFTEYTSELLINAQNHDINVYCLLLDVDDFKKVNDTYGHEVGDEALVKLAETLKLNIRDEDIAARYGGEEFVVVLTKYSREQALLRTEKIRKDISNLELLSNNHEFSITVSIGFCVYEKSMSLSDLLKKADTALYKAKNTGKNKVCESELNGG